MRSSTATATHERARPLLGTIVRIRVPAGPDADAVFVELAACHRTMSFQSLDSDLGRIARAPALDGDGVTLARALRIDLPGIAKGFAVDPAVATLAALGIGEAVVEAGGDLRVPGTKEEPIALRPSATAQPAMVMLADGALAASDPALARARSGRSEHLDGRTGEAAPDRFVAVAAPCRADADALSELMLALGDGAAPLLGGAIAYRHDGRGWSTLGGGG